MTKLRWGKQAREFNPATYQVDADAELIRRVERSDAERTRHDAPLDPPRPGEAQPRRKPKGNFASEYFPGPFRVIPVHSRTRPWRVVKGGGKSDFFIYAAYKTVEAAHRAACELNPDGRAKIEREVREQVQHRY